MALETELHYFEAHKAELEGAHPGQFVLIKGEKLIGAFTTQQAAYAAGVEKFGNTPFLIRHVSEEPSVSFLALRFGLLLGDS